MTVFDRFAKRSGVLSRPALAIALWGFLSLPVSAFPPAPFFTLYGTVRDESGNRLRVEGASVVFFRNGTEFLRQAIQADDELDRNYQIRLRMDMMRNGTRTYSTLANNTGTPFTLGVVLHDVVHYPIEMTATSHAVGSPGERVRLDLTLGADSDGDGIPDAWEQSQLYAGGFLPDESGWDLSLIDRDGDFDRDGVSNRDEYIAGTYATDPTDYLTLQITAKFPNSVRLGFYGILGKTYSLEVSSDFRNWTPAGFYLSNPADPDDGPDDPDTSANDELAYETDDFDPSRPPVRQNGWSPELTGVIQLYTLAETSDHTFYRLKVR